MKISSITLSRNDIDTITNILNRGNQVEIKKEKENVVIIEIKRYVADKRPIIELNQ